MNIISLSKKTEHIQETLDKIESDLISDRSEIEIIKNKLDSIVSLLNGIRDRLPRTENKIADAVQEGVEAASDGLLKDIKSLTDRKIVVVTKPSTLWRKLFKK